MSGGDRGAAASAASVSAASRSACASPYERRTLCHVETTAGCHYKVPCAVGLQKHAALHIAWLRGLQGPANAFQNRLDGPRLVGMLRHISTAHVRAL